MSRLRVLQVITGLLPGGAERLVLDMMRMFNSDLVDVRLASIVDNLSALEIYGCPNLSVEVFNLRGGSRFTNLHRMRHYVNSFSPHVIHAHMFHSLIAAVVVTRFLKPAPAICFTSHRNRYSAARSLSVRLLKNFRSADIIFTPEQHPELNVYHTRVIVNGVTVPAVPPPRTPWNSARTLRLLAVGRLVEQKDPLGLLRCLAQANLPNWSLEFVGSGPLEGAARALAREMGLSDKVSFLGVRSDIRERMRNADVFVMHSRTEGMPMALLEAGAEAMPVVATPVGSIPKIIGNDRGILAPAEGFAQALWQVAETPNAALTAGRLLWSYVAKMHSIEATAKAHETLYNELAMSRYHRD